MKAKVAMSNAEMRELRSSKIARNTERDETGGAQ